jgi:hypothetical protein
MDLSANTPIKRQNSNEGGLIGGWFSFEEGGPLYGISCNHVIADINRCKVGDVLTDFNGSEIGTLTHWLRLADQTGSFVNKAEFAFFRPAEGLRPSWGQRSKGFVKAKKNAKAIFTCYDYESFGTVTETLHPVAITWGNLVYHFRCIEITSDSERAFSMPGHSGGMVLSSGYLLGLILGIDNTGRKTYLVPFQDGILDIVNLFV